MKTIKVCACFSAVFIALQCLFACQKEDKETRDLLLGTWQMEGWSGYCPAGNKTNSPASYKDNTVTFNADSTFFIDYGSQRGAGEPEGNNSGKWTSEVKNGVRTIYIKSGSFSLCWSISSFVIKELDADKLVFDWSLKGAHPNGPTVYRFNKEK